MWNTYKTHADKIWGIYGKYKDHKYVKALTNWAGGYWNSWLGGGKTEPQTDVSP